MSYKRGDFLLIVLIFLFLYLSVGMAQEKGSSKGGGRTVKTEKAFGFTNSRAPIDILSDTVEADQKNNTVTFKGNVIAKQEDTTLYTNTLIITYDQNNRLKEIIAVGNVKVIQLDRRATGQRATFDPDKNRVILDGEAVIREGANVIRGERIIFFIDEERSIVEGGKGGRVTTSITPPPKEEEEKRK